MIIKRKFATYGQLVADKSSKEAIEKVFERYGVSGDVYDYILDPYNDVIVMNTDMGSGIPGEAYQELKMTFEKLDVTDPFDNGLTYRDVDKVRTFSSSKGKAIQQFMWCSKAESPTLIVQVVAFEYVDGELRFIEPWDVGTIGL